MVSNIQIGDLVWARMRSYSPWPGRVVKPGPNCRKAPKRDMHWIYFFGTCDNAWIESHNIKPYVEFKQKFIEGCRTSVFKQAIKDIEEFIEIQKKDPNFQPSRRTSEADSYREDDVDSPSPRTPKQKATAKRKSSMSPDRSSPKRRRYSETLEENGFSSNDIQQFDSTDVEPAAEETSDDYNVPVNYATSSLRFGFVGMGTMGKAIAKNLAKRGHNLYIWNRTASKCKEVKNEVDESAQSHINICEFPFSVFLNSDIIFSCLSDARIATDMINSKDHGLLAMAPEFNAFDQKGYVEMTGIDPETSEKLRKAVEDQGGRYLEAQIQGSKVEAEEGHLVVLCAGDQKLYQECRSCLSAMGKTAFYLGSTIGLATKFNMILQFIKGICLAGLAEAIALAERCDISNVDFVRLLTLSSVNSPYLVQKAEKITSRNFTDVDQSIELMRKDMKMAVEMSDRMKQPLLMGSKANEIYKEVANSNLDGWKDVASIYLSERKTFHLQKLGEYGKELERKKQQRPEKEQ